MDATLMIRQILDANKKAFEDSLSAMITFQEHAEKMVRMFWEKSPFLPHESTKVMDEWASRYKDSLDDFKANVDKRFKLMEYYIVNATDQVESSMHTVINKTVPVTQSYEATKKPAVREEQEEHSVKKTVKKKKTKLDKEK